MDLKSVNFDGFAKAMRDLVTRELEQRLDQLRMAIDAAHAVGELPTGELIERAVVAEIVPVAFQSLGPVRGLAQLDGRAELHFTLRMPDGSHSQTEWRTVEFRGSRVTSAAAYRLLLLLVEQKP